MDQKFICSLGLCLDCLPRTFQRAIKLSLALCSADATPFFTSGTLDSGPTIHFDESIFVEFEYPTAAQLVVDVRDAHTNDRLGVGFAKLADLATQTTPYDIVFNIDDIAEKARLQVRMTPAQRYGTLTLRLSATGLSNTRGILGGVMKLRADVSTIDRETGAPCAFLFSTEKARSKKKAAWQEVVVPLAAIGTAAAPRRLAVRVSDIHKDNSSSLVGACTIDPLKIFLRGAKHCTPLYADLDTARSEATGGVGGACAAKTPTAGSGIKIAGSAAPVGQLCAETVDVALTPSLLEYVAAGATIEPMFFLDMSAGAGGRHVAGSPHEDDGDMERTIEAMQDVLRPTAPDKMFRVFTYGGLVGDLPGDKDAIPPPVDVLDVSECETAGPRDLSCEQGADAPPGGRTPDAVGAYVSARKRVHLWGPGRASPGLRHAITAAERLDLAEGEPGAFVLAVFFATNEFVDRDAFLAAAVQAAEKKLPLAVVVLGVGDRADFFVLSRYFSRQAPGAFPPPKRAPAAIQGTIEACSKVPRDPRFLTFTEPIDAATGRKPATHAAIASRATRFVGQLAAESFWQHKANAS